MSKPARNNLTPMHSAGSDGFTLPKEEVRNLVHTGKLDRDAMSSSADDLDSSIHVSWRVIIYPMSKPARNNLTPMRGAGFDGSTLPHK